MSEKKNLNFDLSEAIARLKEKVVMETDVTATGYLPDIIHFGNSPRYLNLPASGVNLFPVQQIILKVFYRGQKGNEHLKLTDDEIEILKDNHLEYVLEKYDSPALFRELVLVLGRRCVSGETEIYSPIAQDVFTIQELWDSGIRNVSVETLNEQTGTFCISRAEIINNGVRKLYRLVLENDRFVDATDNHPLLTQSGWKQVKELSVGDRIAVPKEKYGISSNNSKGNVLWKQIARIDDWKYGETFDLCIVNGPSPNFIGNGIVLHNSGKDLLTSLIASYEAMKLLELPGGSPFRYYGLAYGNPLYIMTVATSSEQAKILFNEIRQKMYASEYFRGKIGKIETDRIYLLTYEDRANNKKLVDEGMGDSQTPGSVIILSGHSNSESLRGKRVPVLLLDEVSSFKTTTGASSGDQIYTALLPSTSDFVIPDKQTVDGKPFLDSKIISISSPRGEEGILYKLWCTCASEPRRLAFKLPTWKVNMKFTEPMLRDEFKLMGAAEFAMEFGAEFAGMSGERFIPEQYIVKAQQIGLELGLTQRTKGVPGLIYFAHLDPATTSHNYALIIIHVEERIRFRTNEHGGRKKEKYKLFVVDHVKTWKPGPNKAISVTQVDEYILDLARRFRFAMVSYDDWNSAGSIEKLKSKGVSSKKTPFRKVYKMSIYDHLEHLLINEQLALPYKGEDAELLVNELKYIKRIYSNNGFRIRPDEQAPITTDDLVDALAGACGVAMSTSYTGYAKGGTVLMPHSRDMSETNWNIGSGTYSQEKWEFLHRKFGKF